MGTTLQSDQVVEQDAAPSLRETLEAALVEHVPEEAPKPARNDAGQFSKPAETPKAQPAAAAPSPASIDPATPAATHQRPSSWKKDYEQDWGTLPPRVQEYILQREGEYAKGVSTYKGQWDSAQPIYEAAAPFMQELHQYGIQPAQWITTLGNAHRTLALGTPEQKVAMLAQLAQNFGVPMQALQTGQVDPQYSMMARELGAMKSQFSQFQQTVQQQEYSAAVQQVEAFKQNAPLMDETVADLMGQLIQNGLATDLQTAYDKAIRLHEPAWTQHQASQAQAAQDAQAQSIAKKRAAAVSPKSSTPTAATHSSGGKSLRDTIASAMESASEHI